MNDYSAWSSNDIRAEIARAQEALDMRVLVPPIEIVRRHGEHYAGLVLGDAGCVTHHVILLPDRPAQNIRWPDAMQWAMELDADLPSPQELTLLSANCRAHTKVNWYWSNKQHGYDYAWCCNLFNGHQHYCRQNSEGGAVAVRRVSAALQDK